MTMREMTQRSGLQNIGDDFETAIFNPLTVSEMMQLMQGNADCLDLHHNEIRESIEAYIQK